MRRLFLILFCSAALSVVGGDGVCQCAGFQRRRVNDVWRWDRYTGRVLTGARKPRAMFAANTRVLKQTHPSCPTCLGGGGGDPGLLPSGWRFHHMWIYCSDGALNMDLYSVFSSSLFMVTPPFCLGLGQQMWVFTYCTMDHQLQPQVDGGSNVNLK